MLIVGWSQILFQSWGENHVDMHSCPCDKIRTEVLLAGPGQRCPQDLAPL